MPKGRRAAVGPPVHDAQVVTAAPAARAPQAAPDIVNCRLRAEHLDQRLHLQSHHAFAAQAESVELEMTGELF